MKNDNKGKLTKVAGGTLLCLGALIVLSGFAMTTTAEYSDTLNIGLLNDQSNRVISGGLMAVCGAIFFAAGLILEEMSILLAHAEGSGFNGSVPSEGDV